MADALATHTLYVRFEKDNLLDHLVRLAGITARLMWKRAFPGFVFQRH